MDAFQSLAFSEDLNQVRELVSRSCMLERRPLLPFAADAKVPREELTMKTKEVSVAKTKRTPGRGGNGV